MSRNVRIEKGLEWFGEVVLKVSAAGQRFGAWLNEIGFQVEDLDDIIEEFSQNFYESTKEVVDHKSQYGWTMTREMAALTYISDEMLLKSKEELDEFFYNYYSEDEWDEYNELKESIQKRIDPKWSELMDDCFFLFEADRHRAAIPAIFSILEGKLSDLFESDEGSGNLIRKLNGTADEEEARFRKLVLYSTAKCLKEGLFASSPFKGGRKETINRHRVLHGRDDPKHWDRADFLRLVTVVSSINYIEEMMEE